MKKLNNQGFTLVELLAVIVVLALLMVVATRSIGGAMSNAKKSALKTEAQKMITAGYTDALAEAMLSGSVHNMSSTKTVEVAHKTVSSVKHTLLKYLEGSEYIGYIYFKDDKLESICIQYGKATPVDATKDLSVNNSTMTADKITYSIYKTDYAAPINANNEGASQTPNVDTVTVKSSGFCTPTWADATIADGA